MRIGSMLAGAAIMAVPAVWIGHLSIAYVVATLGVVMFASAVPKACADLRPFKRRPVNLIMGRVLPHPSDDGWKFYSGDFWQVVGSVRIVVSDDSVTANGYVVAGSWQSSRYHKAIEAAERERTRHAARDVMAELDL